MRITFRIREEAEKALRYLQMPDSVQKHPFLS